MYLVACIGLDMFFVWWAGRSFRVAASSKDEGSAVLGVIGFIAEPVSGEVTDVSLASELLRDGSLFFSAL